MGVHVKITVDILGMVMHTITCVCGRGGGGLVGGGEPRLRPTLAIAESYQRGKLLIEVLSTMVIWLL